MVKKLVERIRLLAVLSVYVGAGMMFYAGLGYIRAWSGNLFMQLATGIWLIVLGYFVQLVAEANL